MQENLFIDEKDVSALKSGFEIDMMIQYSIENPQMSFHEIQCIFEESSKKNIPSFEDALMKAKEGQTMEMQCNSLGGFIQTDEVTQINEIQQMKQKKVNVLKNIINAFSSFLFKFEKKKSKVAKQNKKLMNLKQNQNEIKYFVESNERISDLQQSSPCLLERRQQKLVKQVCELKITVPSASFIRYCLLQQKQKTPQKQTTEQTERELGYSKNSEKSSIQLACEGQCTPFQTNEIQSFSSLMCLQDHSLKNLSMNELDENSQQMEEEKCQLNILNLPPTIAIMSSRRKGELEDITSQQPEGKLSLLSIQNQTKELRQSVNLDKQKSQEFNFLQSSSDQSIIMARKRQNSIDQTICLSSEPTQVEINQTDGQQVQPAFFKQTSQGISTENLISQNLNFVRDPNYITQSFMPLQEIQNEEKSEQETHDFQIDFFSPFQCIRHLQLPAQMNSFNYFYDLSLGELRGRQLSTLTNSESLLSSQKFLRSKQNSDYSPSHLLPRSVIEETIAEIYRKYCNLPKKGELSVGTSLQNVLSSFKRFMKDKIVNKANLTKLLNSKVYNKLLEYYLVQFSAIWLESCQVQDKIIHQIVIKFLLKCCHNPMKINMFYATKED